MSQMDFIVFLCISPGDSTCGQRAIYHSLGLSGIPIVNVNNNCSTGSTALFMARQLIQGGEILTAIYFYNWTLVALLNIIATPVMLLHILTYTTCQTFVH